MALENVSTDIRSALAASIRENRIVHLKYENLDSRYVPTIEALTIECEDHVANGDVHEFWGVTEDGDEWRVHVTQPRCD